MSQFRTPWRGVAAAFALNGAMLGTWASRVPAFVEKHDLGESTLGLLLLMMGFGALISFPLAGRLADRLGAVRVTRWIAIVHLAALVAVGLAPTPVFLGFALFFFGMCHGSMDVTMNSWATEVEKHMGRSVMASFHAMWSLGAGFGAAMGFAATSVGMAVDSHLALVAMVTALLTGPFIAIAWTSITRPHDSTAPVFAFPRGTLVLVGLIAMSAGLGEGAVTDWSAVYLRDTILTSEAHATLGYAIFSVTMVIMRLLADRLITRFGPSLIARIGGISAATGITLIVAIPSLPSALVGFMFMGIGYAALIPLAFSRAASDPVIPPGQGIASVATLGYGAMLLGPPLIGAIAEASSLRFAFVLIGAFALLIAALAPVLERKTGTLVSAAE